MGRHSAAPPGLRSLGRLRGLRGLLSWPGPQWLARTCTPVVRTPCASAAPRPAPASRPPPCRRPARRSCRRPARRSCRRPGGRSCRRPARRSCRRPGCRSCRVPLAAPAGVPLAAPAGVPLAAPAGVPLAAPAGVRRPLLRRPARRSHRSRRHPGSRPRRLAPVQQPAETGPGGGTYGARRQTGRPRNPAGSPPSARVSDTLCLCLNAESSRQRQWGADTTRWISPYRRPERRDAAASARGAARRAASADPRPPAMPKLAGESEAFTIGK